MTCDAVRALLELRPVGLIEAADAAVVEAHLAGCPACTAEAAALEAAYGAIAEDAEEAVREPVAVGVRERALQAAEAASRPSEAKPAAPAPAPVDPARVEAVGRRIALGCSYCHAKATREEIVFCAACLAPHHEECFRIHGRCSLPGCEEAETVRPGRQEPPRTRPRVRGLVIALSIVGAGGVAALSATLVMAQRREVERAAREQLEAQLQRSSEERFLHAQELQERDRQIAQLTSQSTGDPSVSLDFQDAPLEVVLAALSNQSGRNVLVAPGVVEKLTLRLRGVPWREALGMVAGLARCRVEPRGGEVYLLARPKRVTVRFVDVSTRFVLKAIARDGGKNVVVDPELIGTMSPAFEDAEWDAALIAVAHAAGAQTWVMGGGIIYVGRTAPPGGVPLTVGGWRTAGLEELLREEPLVDLDLRDATVEAAAAEVARRAGRKVEIRGHLDPARRITLALHSSPWRAALGLIAERGDCEVEADGRDAVLSPIVRIGTLRARAAPLGAWVALLDALGSANGGRALNVVVPGELGLLPVTIDFEDARPEEVVAMTASLLGCELVAEGQARRFQLRRDLPPDRTVRAGPIDRPDEPRLQALALSRGGIRAVIAGAVLRAGDDLPRTENGVYVGMVVSLDAEGAKVRLQGRADDRMLRLDPEELQELTPAPPPSIARPFLGCDTVRQDPPLVGLLVTSVTPESPAAAAGLRPGNRLLTVRVLPSGETVTLRYAVDLEALLSRLDSDAQVEIAVQRGGLDVDHVLVQLRSRR